MVASRAAIARPVLFLESELKKNQRWLIIASLVALYFIWGSTFLAMKFAIESFPPFLMSALRFLFAGALLYSLLRLRGAPNPNRPQWINAAMVGTLLLSGGNAGVAYAQQWVATGAAALTIATVPIWSMLFSALWGNKPYRREWQGIGLGILGVLMLTMGNNMQASPLGASVLLLAAASWAFGSVWSKQLSMPYGAMSSAVQMLVAGTVLIIMSLSAGEHIPASLTARSLWSLAYLVVFGSFIAYSAYLYLLNTVRPALATSYAFVNPLIAILLGTWLAGEQIDRFEWLALLMILGGVTLVLFAKKH